jgi:hypothetical protein
MVQQEIIPLVLTKGTASLVLISTYLPVLRKLGQPMRCPCSRRRELSSASMLTIGSRGLSCWARRKELADGERYVRLTLSSLRSLLAASNLVGMEMLLNFSGRHGGDCLLSTEL